MTGISWFKLMTFLNPKHTFPSLENILSNNVINSMDKNKIPLASIRTSLNLDPSVDQNLQTDSKSFVFVLQNIPLHSITEDI